MFYKLNYNTMPKKRLRKKTNNLETKKVAATENNDEDSDEDSYEDFDEEDFDEEDSDEGSDHYDSDYVEEEEEENVVNCSEVFQLQIVFKKDMARMQCKKHFRSDMGGGKKKTAIVTLIGRMSHLLAWLGVKNQCTDLYDTVIMLLKSAYGSIMEYFKFMSDKMHKKPATILSYIDDCSSFLNWFLLFFNNGEAGKKYDSKGYDAVAKAARKMFKRVCKKQNGAASKDIASQKRLSKWPNGGLIDLIKQVETDVVWVSTITDETIITPKIFRTFVKIMCGAAYVTPQGRPQAIMDLRNQQLPELRTSQFVLSSTSKTAAAFGYQPVTIGKMFETCIDKYVRYIRPKIKTRANDFFFIDLKGKKINMGQKLTNYFESRMNLHITTNTIRSIVETEMDQLHEAGAITNAERNAIMNMNGHSSMITKDYYIRKDRAQDVKHALSAFAAISRPATNQIVFESESETDDDEELVPVARKRSRHHSIIFDSDEETDYREPPVNKNKVFKQTPVQRVQHSDSEAEEPTHAKQPRKQHSK